MYSQLPSLCLYLLVSTAVAPVTAADVVTCPLERGDNLSKTGPCYCKSVRRDQTPWPSDDGSKTAPEPKEVSLHFKKVDGKIEAKINWIVDKQYIQKIHGFYMQIMVPNGYYDFNNCSFNATTLQKTSNDSTLRFEFEDCCQSLIVGSGFTPGKSVDVKLHSLPLYYVKDKAYFAKTEKIVPNFSAPRKKKLKNKGKGRGKGGGKGHKGGKNGNSKRNETKRVGGHQETSYSFPLSSYILTAVLATFATFTVCLVICIIAGVYVSKRYMPSSQTTKKQRVLLIGDDTDEYFIKIYNRLIETLKKCSVGDVEIVANIRSVSEIAATGIIPWATENIRNSDIVLFVIFNINQVKTSTETEEQRRRLSQKRSLVGVTLGIAESETVKSSFGQSKKKYVVLHTHRDSYESNLLSYCTQYLLRKDFKKVLKHVLGRGYNQSVDIREDYDYMLKQIPTVQQQPCVNAPATKTNNLNCSLILDPSSITTQNSLDHSFLYRDENKSGGDAYPSIEANAMV